MPSDNEAVVSLYLVAQSDAAMLFSKDELSKTGSFWVPRSLIRHISKGPHTPEQVAAGKLRECKITIPSWKCDQLNLEDES